MGLLATRKLLETLSVTVLGIVMISVPVLAGEVGFIPAPGNFPGPVTVTMDASGSTRIHYTLDGTEPDSSSPVYRGPLFIEDDTVIRYFTTGKEGSQSSVQEVFYRIQHEQPLEDELGTVADPPGGVYSERVLVTLSTGGGGTIYYTLDGSDPTESSLKYRGPFQLVHSAELKFIAVDKEGNRSRIYDEYYSLRKEAAFSEAFPDTGLYTSPVEVKNTTSDDEAPVTVVDPPGGIYVPPINVTLRTEEGARTYYSLDGNDPDTKSPLYFSGFTFNKPTTLKFFSMDQAGNMERIQTHTYELVNGVWRKYTRGVYLIPSVTDGNTFWIGSESGLAVYHVVSGERSFLGEKEGLLGKVINDLVLDEEGELWIATDLGLNHLRPGTGFDYYTPAEGLPDREVLCLGVDRDGSVWAGTRMGVSRIRDGVVLETLRIADGLPDNTVLSVAVDYSGNKWFGTSNGLARFTGKEWRIFSRESGMVDEEVRTVAVDSQWNIWVGTPRGVSMYDQEKWVSFTKSDGLPGNAVVLIAPDPDGDVWIATRTGVVRYSNGEFIKENPL